MDAIWPSRLRTSDGGINLGAPGTDHGNGDALDITYDPASGPNLDALAQRLLASPGVSYVVWANQIQPGAAAAAMVFGDKVLSPGTWADYCAGQMWCNPHHRHLHVSLDPKSRANLAVWDLSGIPTGDNKVFVDKGANDSLPERGVVAPPASFDPSQDVGDYLKRAWDAGSVDGVSWVSVPVGPFVLHVASDALSVLGVRVPSDARSATAIAHSAGALLPTREMVDAIRAAAVRKPLLPQIPGLPATWQAVRQVADAMPPVNAGVLTAAVGAQPWVLATPMGLGAVGYAPPGQPLDRQFDAAHVDYTRLLQLVRTTAELNGQPIDLLTWLGKSHPPGLDQLGGPVPLTTLAQFHQIVLLPAQYQPGPLPGKAAVETPAQGQPGKQAQPKPFGMP